MLQERYRVVQLGTRGGTTKEAPELGIIALLGIRSSPTLS
jgi:hypothetical protein